LTPFFLWKFQLSSQKTTVQAGETFEIPHESIGLNPPNPKLGHREAALNLFVEPNPGSLCPFTVVTDIQSLLAFPSLTQICEFFLWMYTLH
jgi:hypothetical protein